MQTYISRMPSLPIAWSKIQEISRNPKATPADLNQVISLDPVLMGRVMKLINSAYYGLNNQITSLVRAIIMLGVNTVKNLALSTAVLSGLSSKSNFQALNNDGFWRHSLCVGVAAKQIAMKRRKDPKQLEEYFVSGLLHDIGKIPLNNKLSAEYVQALALTDKEHLALYIAEERTMEVNHCEVGRFIVKNWNLGASMEDVVFFHHFLDSYPGENRDVLLTVAAANYFANSYQIGFSGDRYPESLPPTVFDELKITRDDLDEVENKVSGEIEKAQIFLKVSQ
ncbi:MAG TPA: HDOD domain-containing protein [Spirochaetia bacterium]|nr:HDOD domain-containing protein [Spirochaetia bacterium]